jgi:histidyl-tRNA synthetase
VAVSGFPEWQPAGRRVEVAVLDGIRRTFELHGFLSLETRSIEPVDVLLRKGEIDKEVYAVRRLHGEDRDDRYALHYDLTVPLARYVTDNAGQLEFPFRRYQIQRVWRGERPQEGRFREFTQADIDIVDANSLAFHHEVEIAIVMSEALAALPIPTVTFRVSNRKLAEGFYRSLGAADPAVVLRIVDKIDKVGPDSVGASLVAEAGLTPAAAAKALALAAISTSDESFVEQVARLGVTDPLLDEGVAELTAFMAGVLPDMAGRVRVDLSIARGFDYYTGTVYETELLGHGDIGSICSGGRYDSLVRSGRITYPGVGLSLGVTRLVSVLLGRSIVTASRAVPTAVLVSVADEASRPESNEIARTLRGRGIPTEVSPTAEKFGRQIRYAERRAIPFVWFGDTVKDIRSGEQTPADPTSWMPPIDDLWPRVVHEPDDRPARDQPARDQPASPRPASQPATSQKGNST